MLPTCGSWMPCGHSKRNFRPLRCGCTSRPSAPSSSSCRQVPPASASAERCTRTRPGLERIRRRRGRNDPGGVVAASAWHATSLLLPGEARRYRQLILTVRSSFAEDHDVGVFSNETWRLADLGAKHALLLAGSGWGLMPEPIVRDDLASGRLVRLDLPEVRSGFYQSPGDLSYGQPAGSCRGMDDPTLYRVGAEVREPCRRDREGAPKLTCLSFGMGRPATADRVNITPSVTCPRSDTADVAPPGWRDPGGQTMRTLVRVFAGLPYQRSRQLGHDGIEAGFDTDFLPSDKVLEQLLGMSAHRGDAVGPELQSERRGLRADVKSSVTWVIALAAAGATPKASRLVVQRTPNAMPSAPSTICAKNPIKMKTKSWSGIVGTLPRQRPRSGLPRNSNDRRGGRAGHRAWR